jgi:hypothetical protein
MTTDDDPKHLAIKLLESELNLANDNLRLTTKVRDRLRTVRRRQHEVPI